MNKKDLFADKIKRVNITTCFPDYDGKSDLIVYIVTKLFNRETLIKLRKFSLLSHYLVFKNTT